MLWYVGYYGLMAHEDSNLNGYTRGIEKSRKKGEARMIRNLYTDDMKRQNIAKHVVMHRAEI
ncbi:hypothetical protein [Bacillus thuringiensis]|uniref:hypothetical protein n=1 Tax=Bacillus thuringiensis TaxID=1428 RepID=UPI001155BE9C|nr:hypothetical protein [Bacillus thuringiensis]